MPTAADKAADPYTIAFLYERFRSRHDKRRALRCSTWRELGLYLHIPFCRKRCHFCYFRVYVDKNAREVEQYLDILAREWERYLETPAIAAQ